MATRRPAAHAAGRRLGQVIAEARTRLTMVDALALAGIDVTLTAADAKPDLNAALGELLARAQRARAVRSDVGFPEVLALIVGLARPVLYRRTPRVVAHQASHERVAHKKQAAV